MLNGLPSPWEKMKTYRIAVSLFLVPLSCGVAFAGMRDDVLEAMGRCAAVADNQARLACYDAAAPRLKDALATPPASLGRAPTVQEQQSWFGFDVGGLFGGGSSVTTPSEFGKERTPEVQATREREEIDNISAHVSDVAFTPFGQFIVFLANGQIWRQVQGDADRARFSSPLKENTVTISRGAFGSYSLTVNDSNHVFKVTRVK
jgi:hypothetical protein